MLRLVWYFCPHNCFYVTYEIQGDLATASFWHTMPIFFVQHYQGYPLQQHKCLYYIRDFTRKNPNPWHPSLRDGVTHRHWPSRQGIEFILVQLKEKIHQNLGNRLGWKPRLDKQQPLYPISTSQPEYQWSSMSSPLARLNQKVGWRLGTKPTWGKVIQLWASTSHGAECIFANHKIHKRLCKYRTDN